MIFSHILTRSCEEFWTFTQKGFGWIHDWIIYKLSHHAIHKQVISHTFATSWHCHFTLICYHLLAPHVAFRTSLHNRGLYFVSAHVEPVSCLLAFFNRCCWFSTLVYSNCYQHEVYCSQQLQVLTVAVVYFYFSLHVLWPYFTFNCSCCGLVLLFLVVTVT